MNKTLAFALKDSLRILKGISFSGMLSWTAGYALGALTGIYPWPSVVTFGSVTVIVAGIALFNRYKESQIKGFTPWELSLRDPDNDASAVVNRSNEHFLVVGHAIEIIPHPQVNSRAALKNLGWNPADVELIDRQQDYDVKELAIRAGGLQEFDPPNGLKFVLVKTSYVTSDSPHLSLETERTDFYTLRSVLPLIKSNPEVRAEFGDLEPSLNRVPHSLCLHYTVRFSTGDVLCMKRDSRSAYHGGLWSFSGEEQVAQQDFEAFIPCLSLFQRTFCEEVLALRDETPLKERWAIASPIVQSMRLLSVFIEEGIHNYSLLGLFQLNCDPTEFVKLHNNLVNRGVGTRDREGTLYLAEYFDIFSLLVEGQCSVEPLFQGTNMEVRSENLHPTSRYRLFRLLRAVNRRPLTIKDYERVYG